MALSFEEFKTEIIKRARDKQICSAFQRLILAKDYLAILKIAKKFSVWLWATNIVDLDLLKEIPAEDLLKSNIYIDKAYLKNPTGDIYVLSRDVVVECSGINKCAVMCLSGTVEINLHENSFAKVKGFFNSEIKVSVVDSSVIDINLTNQSKLKFRSDKETNSNIVTNENSKCIIESYGSSFVNLKGLDNSDINIQKFDDSQIKVRTASSVTINEIKTDGPEL
jgi:hypothetical protein